MAASNVMVNNYLGIAYMNYDIATWQLNVVKNTGDILKVTINNIKGLPETEIIYSFKCVEGCDQVQHWADVRFINFINKDGLQEQSKSLYIDL